jgi:molybdopterin-guanine dinucleotide biosynthesis protein A
MNLAAVILAGGASRRMRRDKAWLEIDGRSLIQIAVEKARALGVAEVYISGRAGVDYSAWRCPVLHDLEPGVGPLGGIERGLDACATELLLVLAVDLPRMSTEFLERLVGRCDEQTGVVPRMGERWESLVAVYPKRCHALAREGLARGRRAAAGFAEACLVAGAVRACEVAAADAPLFANWNSPADLPAPLRGDVD